MKKILWIIAMFITNIALAQNYTIDGHVFDDRWATLNGFNVSYIDDTGKELCRSMSKQIFDYWKTWTWVDVPKILQIPLLRENWYINMSCNISWDVKTWFLGINEGTFSNIEWWMIKIPFNTVSTLSWSVITLWSKAIDNYRLILKKRKSWYYYDLLRAKKYEALPDDLKISSNWTDLIKDNSFKFDLYIDGAWNGDTLGITVDWVNFTYSKNVMGNPIRFDRKWKFEKDIASVDIEIQALWIKEKIFATHLWDVTVKIPAIIEKKDQYALINIDAEFKDYIFRNSQKNGYFEGVWTYENWKIMNYVMYQKQINSRSDWSFQYVDICKKDECPRFLKVFDRNFVYNGSVYEELKKDWQIVHTDIKKDKDWFFAKSETWYKMIFWLFITILIFFVLFWYIGIERLKTFKNMLSDIVRKYLQKK